MVLEAADTNSQTYYGTEEVSEITGISAYTIRYYDKCGFFPRLKRKSRKVRLFSDIDVERLKLIDALRKSGLSIEGVSYFIKLESTNGSVEKLKDMLVSQKSMLELQRDDIDEKIALLQKAIDGCNNE